MATLREGQKGLGQMAWSDGCVTTSLPMNYLIKVGAATPDSLSEPHADSGPRQSLCTRLRSAGNWHNFSKGYVVDGSRTLRRPDDKK